MTVVRSAITEVVLCDTPSCGLTIPFISYNGDVEGKGEALATRCGWIRHPQNGDDLCPACQEALS